MGVSTYPGDGQDVETLLMNADAAMYSAKDAGRDKIRFYTAKMNAKVHERLSLQEQLRSAIPRSEFFLVYQPQADLRTGRIFAVEALLRWRHPTLGLISPATFIPIAEESGLIVSIGDWVLRTACRQNRAWQDAGADAVTMAVNVSARQFDEKSWTVQVENALRESGMQAKYLELEVTESVLMHDLQRAIATMRDLKALGVQFSIDDFGTGYSSLSALKAFPVSRLKIDQSFVRDLPNDENDKAIASAVISMGHKLGLKVIAEGVESDKQLAFLRDNDCDEIQGYLLSKPVSPAEMQVILNSQSTMFGNVYERRPLRCVDTEKAVPMLVD
jgi:EAL domain-containing protein (putative c-di-GMP-specific phosphodiesterase class I)